MRKRPMLFLACMFLAGIAASAGAAGIACASALLLGLSARVWREHGVRRWLSGIGFVLMFVAGMFRMESQQRFRQQYLPELEDGQNIRLVGEISRIEEKTRCVCYILKNCAFEQAGAQMPCNRVAAYISSDEFSVGQILVVKGTISMFERAANEGGFDEAQYYQSQKIDFGVRVQKVESVRGEGDWFCNVLADIRKRLADSIVSVRAEDGVLAAMLLGDKSQLDGEVKALYQSSGIGHILAISGLHVSLLGIGLYRLLRRCRLSYVPACAGTAVFMVSYALMTGAGVSTRRAVGMLLVYLVADVSGKNYDMLSALGFVTIVLLWDNPFLIGYSGFLFSVVAVLGAGGTAPLLVEWWHSSREEKQKPHNSGLGKWMDSLLVSFGIQITTLPLVAFVYYEIPVYAVLINIIVLALVKYFLGLGTAAAVIGVWAVWPGTILMVPCNWILRLYGWICTLTLRLPGARIITGFPGMRRVIFYYVILGLMLLLMQYARVREKHCKGAVICVWTVALAAVICVQTPKNFEIDMLDVGQGDGIYFCTTDGISMFVDGGSSDVSGVGTYRILPFLKYKGADRISYWFVSHTDTDHTNGLIAVLESGYRVETLVFSKLMQGEQRTEEIAALAREHGTNVLYMERGDILVAGDARLNCLYPAGNARWNDMLCDADVNELCLVLLLEDREFRGIFTGDISASVEQELLQDNGGSLSVDFYKAAHHGSRYSNSSDWLQALHPAVAGISYGADNRYGHPGAEALAHMQEAGAKVFGTAEYGRICVRQSAKTGLLVDGYRKETGCENSE